MKQGICKLCLLEKPLCNSHLIPARLYRYCWAGDRGPLRFTSKEVANTDEELTAYLLCSACENLLNRDGENWLVPKLATIEQTFPFYDLLVKGKPDVVEKDFLAYACSRNKEIGFRKLTNFVIGVFWKASVDSWRTGKISSQIELGEYQESFRLFLTHKGKFPEQARLTVLVSPPENALIGFNLPELRRKQPFHQYLFYIPGIAFVLAVGKGIPQGQKNMCFYSSPLHPILVGDISEGIVRSVNHGARNAIRRQQATPLLPPRKNR